MTVFTQGIIRTMLAGVLFAVVATSAAASPETGFGTLDGGIKARTLQEGAGPAAEDGMVATIHFTGWLDDSGARGRELVNSRRDGEAVSFVIGTDRVMPAWNVGVRGMRAGQKRLLLVPPAMAWGERGVEGLVPPNAPVMFQIELVRLEPGAEAR